MKSEMTALAVLLTLAVAIVLAFAVTSPTLGLAFALVVVGALVLLRLGVSTLAWWTAWFTPFQAAFVIDVGITLRLAFLAGVALVGLAAMQGRIGWPRWHPAAKWLGAFLTVVVLSTVVMTPFAPAPSLAELSGWRGVPLMRPMLQCLQLAAMVGIMLTMARLARQPTGATRLLWALVFSGLVVTAYGYYMFAAPLVGVPAIDINNAMNTNFTRGAVVHGMSMGGVSLPRVRSTFVEPLNFGNYLLVVIGGLWGFARLSGRRRLTLLTLGAVLFLFLVGVNSRGAMFGAGAALVAMTAFAAAPWQLVKALVKLVVAVVVVGGLVLVVAPLVVPGMSVAWLIDFFVLRLTAAFGPEARIWTDLQDVGVVWRQYPLFGVGFGNLPFYLAQTSQGIGAGVVDAGSLYTRVLAETGVAGLILWVGFVGRLLMVLVRTGRDGTREPATRTLAMALYFIVVADAVSRFANVGIATDVHIWVVYGLALGVCYRLPSSVPKQEALA